MTTTYEFREDGCDRCGQSECDVVQWESRAAFPRTEPQYLCVFCFETHLGNILDYPKLYPDQQTLARGIIGAGHVLLRAIAKLNEKGEA